MHLLSQIRLVEADRHPPGPLPRAGELVVADTYGRSLDSDLCFRRRRGRQVRRRDDEDSAEFGQGISRLPSESKSRLARVEGAIGLERAVTSRSRRSTELH